MRSRRVVMSSAKLSWSGGSLRQANSNGPRRYRACDRYQAIFPISASSSSARTLESTTASASPGLRPGTPLRGRTYVPGGFRRRRHRRNYLARPRWAAPGARVAGAARSPAADSRLRAVRKQDLPRCSPGAATAGGLAVRAEGPFDLAAMKDCGPGRTVRLAVLQVTVPELVGRACLSQYSSLRRASSLRRVSNLSSAGRAGRMQAAIRLNPRRTRPVS